MCGRSLDLGVFSFQFRSELRWKLYITLLPDPCTVMIIQTPNDMRARGVTHVCVEMSLNINIIGELYFCKVLWQINHNMYAILF